jgi:hypothetical protein
MIKVNLLLKKEGNTIPVTGCEGLGGCETSGLPHFPDNQLTDGEEVSLTHWQPFIPRKLLVLISVRG